jgi:predicted site-specific integrase-resolvase
MAERDYLSEPEAAAALQIHPKTLARWRKAGEVAHDLTVGGRIRYQFTDLIAPRRKMRVAADAPKRSHMSGGIEPPL